MSVPFLCYCLLLVLFNMFILLSINLKFLFLALCPLCVLLSLSYASLSAEILRERQEQDLEMVSMVFPPLRESI